MSKGKRVPEIGSKLRAIRGEMDQRGFARQLQVSQQVISHYEHGNIPGSWEFLRRLSKGFDVSINWLLVSQSPRTLRAVAGHAPLADNRRPDWSRDFLDQVIFEETDVLELVLHYYFLYLATEPADAKSRLMADLQALIDAVRAGSDADGAPPGETQALLDVYNALAADDRRSAVHVLIHAGERIEKMERAASTKDARKLYRASLSLARIQGWRNAEVESARRIGRSYRKEGRWNEADLFFRIAVDRFANGGQAVGEPAPAAPADPDLGRAEGDFASSTVLAPTRARTLLGYGHVAREQGDLASARERYLEALESAFKCQDPVLRAEVYLDLAGLACRGKEWAKASEFLASGRTFVQAGDGKVSSRFSLTEALVRRQRGDLSGAEAVLRELHAKSTTEGDLRTFALASLNLAEILRERDGGQEALDLLDRTASLADAHGDPRNLALRKLLYARLKFDAGQNAEATRDLLACLRFARDKGLTAEFDQAVALLSDKDAVPPFPMLQVG